MLKIIDEKRLLRKCQQRFQNLLAPFSEKSGEILIGGPGWHNKRKVNWSKSLGIWWTSYDLENRFENSFGVVEPDWDSKKGYSVTCVIDIPHYGINRRIGGAFAENEDEFYLLHRGRIGGGRKDIGKELFKKIYRGKLVFAEDGKITSNLALVGALNSERFPTQLAIFVHEMQRIKDTSKIKLELKQEMPAIFNEEFVGPKEYSAGHIKAECDHGLVVNHLADLLKSMDYQPANRRPIDLYIVDDKSIVTSLFEIKTDVTTTDCYTALGQLFFYSSVFTEKPALFAVFPENIREQFQQVFKAMGIHVVLYKWDKGKPVFINLHL